MFLLVYTNRLCYIIYPYLVCMYVNNLPLIIQENLSVRMSQAQLEEEVSRLREELQRRETALHRAHSQTASQARELSGALQELAVLRTAREQGEGEEEEEEEGEEGSEVEENASSIEEYSQKVFSSHLLHDDTLLLGLLSLLCVFVMMVPTHCRYCHWKESCNSRKSWAGLLKLRSDCSEIPSTAKVTNHV